MQIRSRYFFKKRRNETVWQAGSSSGSEAGSHLRLIDSCITQLEAQEPPRTCNESKEESTTSSRTLTATSSRTLSTTLSRALRGVKSDLEVRLGGEQQLHHRFIIPAGSQPERECFIDNLLVRIHLIAVMSRWTSLAPWEFEFPFSGSLTSTGVEIL